MTLDDYDVKAGDTVYIQDMGTQVSYRLVILKHYLFIIVENSYKYWTNHYFHFIQSLLV